MANETQIGELSISLKMRLEGLEKGLETAQKKLQSIEKQNEQLKNSNSQLDASFIAMSASIIASLAKIKSAIDDGVDKYHSYVNGMNALQKTAKSTNNSILDIKNAMDDVNKFKFIDDADLSKSMQNLLRYGFTVEQASEMLKIMQDAAVGNREPQYELSEAIKVTTDGIRMENSVLSNAVGVEKNISKMLEEHANKLGKTTDALTQAEKVQAVYNGFMDEASEFTGSAAEMADTYQGKQAQANAINLEFSRTLGESMIPSLTQYSSLQLAITKGITSFISNHKSATSGIVSFTTALLATVVALTAVRKAYIAYKTAATAADMTTKAFTASLLSNPITLVAVAIASVVAGYSAYCTKAQETAEAQEKLNQVTEKYNAIKEGTYKYTESSANDLETERQNIEKQLEYKQKQLELQEKEKQLSAIVNKSVFDKDFDFSQFQQADKELGEVQKQLKDLQKQYNENVKENGNFGNSLEELNEKLKTNQKGISEANAAQKIKKAMDTESVKTQQKEAAQLKLNVDQMQKYLNVVKKGNTNTSQYKEAVKELSKTYPEAANAEGIIIDKAQDYINAEKAKANQSWNTSQQTIQDNIEVANTFIKMAEQAENDKNKQVELANQIGIAYEQIIPTLTSVVNILSAMGSAAPATVAGITPKSVSTKSSGGGSKSYQNKKLDNYKALIEYKKSLDQISLKQEIKMYETALKKYAKTTAEKRELRTKIYELNKEMAQKEKELLDKQTEDYEAYIQKQKNAKGAAYDVKEQTKDYDKIIQMHQKYLKQIMKDERLSLEERKEIYREELSIVRDYEQQKRDLRVEQIDNTVSQLTNAITKQLEEMQKKDKEMIDKNIEEVEKWKKVRIDAINAEYDARIEAIEKELEVLDKAEQQKSRDEEDAEHEKKKKRLEDLIAFEHDAVNKANYQKELDKLIAEYQKTLDKRALEDKKEALNAQKDLLQEEQDNKVQAVEDEVEKQKEVYEKQLEDLEKYYEQQTNMAQETAEKMLLNVQKNQDTILNLLKNYGDKYEITGQSLGEKLAQGINNGLSSKIENIIQKIQDTIDSNLEKKIKEWTASSYKYEANANKPQMTSVNIYQTNNIEQNPEMPSETYRKLNNVSQKLAEEFAGM